MNPWVESVLIVLLSFAVFWAAYRIQKASWVWMSCGLVGIAGALASNGACRGREYSLLMSVAVPMLTAPLFRFPLSKTLRIGLFTVTALAAGFTGWYEFLAAAFSRRELALLKTHFHDGVCIQSTGYTCGPASAVTLLRRLGFPAEEGELALLSKCSLHTGTDGPLLADAINARYGPERVKSWSCEFTDMDALQRAGEVLTVVNLDDTTDHWVVVLKITESTVETADPIYGLHTESRSDFERRWRWESVVVKVP